MTAKIIALVRQRPGIPMAETYVDLFEVDEKMTREEAERAMRAAIEEFMTTPEGREAWKESCEDFNWGDAVIYLSQEVWAKYGLKLLDDTIPKIDVAQDEIFRPQ